MKTLKSFLFYTLLFTVFFAAQAFAGGNDAAAAAGDGPFGTVTEKLTDAFKNTRTVIFVVGGFGLVGLAVGAIFGKVNWKWFASLAIGLVIVAVAGAIINYATDDDDVTSTAMGDTLTGE